MSGAVQLVIGVLLVVILALIVIWLGERVF
jgi:hypothetical protein